MGHYPPEVKLADNILLMTEKRDLMVNGPKSLPWTFGDDVPVLAQRIKPWSWQTAERKFLDRFARLTA